jgi:beta-N-acetylhexosaminidase
MSSEQSKLGPLLIGLEGVELTARDEDSLAHPAVGGVVLFTRNYRDPQQLRALTTAIREQSGRPLLITVDHEGGRVQRFREGFTRLPPLAVLGRIHAERADRGLDMAYRHGRVMATELLVQGVDMSFAPVLDLDRGSSVIGDRAFAESPDAVAELASFYLAGMHDAGMRTCGKHFPGHGSVAADSHTDDVTDERSLTDLQASDLLPFARLAPQLDSVMMAHVSYPQVDPAPAGYSTRWIGDILRRDMGFTGTVLSDDLVMQAAVIAGKLADRLQASLEAGCDAALVCDPQAARELLDELAAAPADATAALTRLRGRSQHTAEEIETVSEWRHWRQSISELEHSKWA